MQCLAFESARISVFSNKRSGCTGATTVSTNEQFTAVANCVTYDGNITIVPSRTTSITTDGPAATVDLNRLEKIHGAIELQDILQVGRFDSNTLQEVETMRIRSSHLLDVGMPELRYVGLLDLHAESVMQTNFSPKLKVSELAIQSYFSLASLMQLEVAEAGTVRIAASGTESITISLEKADHIKIESSEISTWSQPSTDTAKNTAPSFPNLTSVTSFNCTYCSGVSLPELASINGSLFIQESKMLSNFSNLRQIGGEVVIRDSIMYTLDFPLLERAGGLRISNTTGIKGIDESNVPLLQEIGDINITGNFDRYVHVI